MLILKGPFAPQFSRIANPAFVISETVLGSYFVNSVDQVAEKCVFLKQWNISKCAASNEISMDE